MKKLILTVFLFITIMPVMSAQVDLGFGIDPASTKWKQIKLDRRKLIFPDYYEDKAMLINAYIDTIRPYITHNLTDRIEKVNLVLHPENTISNAFVSYNPKKMGIFTPPLTNSYSLPYLKQIVAHEYRHLVQFSNLNARFVKGLGYVFGQTAVVLGTLFVPQWYFEGEATFVETQFAMNGRGEQPVFSIGMRALLNEGVKLNKITYNKWILGSVKDYTPTDYEFGYFMTAAAYKYYGDNYWNKILDYTAGGNIWGRSTASKRQYGVKPNQLFVRSMEELREFWHAESQKPNTSTLLDVPIHSYTTYKSAQHFNDDLIIAQKESLSEINQIVVYDKRTSKERRLRNIPAVMWNHDRITVKDSSVYWSEYKFSLFWSQRVSSVIKKADIYQKKGKIHLSRPKTIYEHPYAVFITPVDHDRYALVSYDIQNNPSIELFDKDFNRVRTFGFDGLDNVFNGMAYDDKTSKLCYILVGEGGARIGTIDVNTGQRDIISGPTYMALTNLSAKDGRVFFGSTESGKDEVHMIDLSDNSQYQITSSQYGSFPGIGGDGSKIALSTYTIDGYMLAEQKFSVDTLRKVDSRLMQPNKKMVVPVKDFGFPKLDTINISLSSARVDSEMSGLEVKKYRKGVNLFSAPFRWGPMVLPLSGLPEDIDDLDVGVGLTGGFINSLNTASGSLLLGWAPKSNRPLIGLDLGYAGLPVQIKLGLNYGGDKQEVYGVSYDSADDFDVVHTGDLKEYFNVDLELSMPMDFSGGTSLRVLTPLVNFSFVNSKVFDVSDNLLFDYSTKLRYGLSYSSQRIGAQKDVAPRYGYSLAVSGMSNPVQKDFGSIINVSAKGYLPGPFRHHSLIIAGAYQYQFENKYNYIQELMFPRGNNLLGAPKQTFASALNYVLPIANPDWIIPGFLNIRRIYFSAFGEYARTDYLSTALSNDRDVYTYGGELFLNIIPFATTMFDFTIGVSVYKASQHKGVGWGISFGANF